MRLLALLCTTAVFATVRADTKKKNHEEGTAVAGAEFGHMTPDHKTRFVRDCSDAPDKNLKHSCLMYQHMDRQARARIAAMRKRRQAAGLPPMPPAPRGRRQNPPRPAAPAAQAPRQAPRPANAPGSPVWQQPIPVPPNARGQSAFHPYDCMTLQCLCPFFRGTMRNGVCILQSGQPLTMAYRKEYRMMNDDERNRYHNALNTLKRNGEYDRLSSQHLAVGVNSGAHSGPGFLPWHREYLKRVEIALRLVDPSISIPYWDSVMDQYLPQPSDSILFSTLFAGETDFYGNVIQGPFAYWRTLEGRNAINRQLAREGSLFNENQVNTIVSMGSIEATMAYTAPVAGCPYPNNYGAIEYIHSNIHLWIGGDMKPPSTSANEPIFFMHHAFVDYLWELWRQLRQPRWLREQAYSADHYLCSNQQHFSYAAMRPFPYLINRDGLSNSYTDQMYRYAPRATCTRQNPNCGSPYLWCDMRGVWPRCAAKIKPGGFCRGTENFDSCYQSRCWWGTCARNAFAAKARAASTQHSVSGNATLRLIDETASTDAPALVRTVPLVKPAFVNCFNRHPCCSGWAAAGECKANPEYMSQFCPASCNVCKPSWNTTDACLDRHVNCGEWKGLGMCEGESAVFMAENCRSACGLCEKDKKAMCVDKKGKHIPVPVDKETLFEISESIDPEVRRAVETAKEGRSVHVA